MTSSVPMVCNLLVVFRSRPCTDCAGTACCGNTATEQYTIVLGRTVMRSRSCSDAMQQFAFAQLSKAADLREPNNLPALGGRKWLRLLAKGGSRALRRKKPWRRVR